MTRTPRSPRTLHIRMVSDVQTRWTGWGYITEDGELVGMVSDDVGRRWYGVRAFGAWTWVSRALFACIVLYWR